MQENDRIAFSAKEVAEFLDTHVAYVYVLTRQRKIPYVRCGAKRIIYPRTTMIDYINGEIDKKQKKLNVLINAKKYLEGNHNG